MIIKPKGTNDLFYPENRRWEYLEKVIKDVFKIYNFEYLRTPIFEDSKLFKRENEFSEMVKKQTYDFTDKGGRLLTLRPEGTAGAIRSIVENKLYLLKKPRFYYYGPFFRYERPQKGVFREFYQFGVEAIGDKNYLLDSEIILMACEIIERLNIKYTLNINYLGNKKIREEYEKSLYKFIKNKENLICDDCKERISNNLLRALDCKTCNFKHLYDDAPRLLDYLDNDEKKYFDGILKTLKETGKKYIIDPFLVRGLDYYTGVVFELKLESGQAILGGGRYDELLKELSGPAIGGIGFGAGCERIISALNLELCNDLDFYIISDFNTKDYAFNILTKLRDANIKCEYDFLDRNFSKKLKEALSKNPSYIIFISDDEKNKNTIKIKNVKTQLQVDLKKENLLEFLKERKYV